MNGWLVLLAAAVGAFVAVMLTLGQLALHRAKAWIRRGAPGAGERVLKGYKTWLANHKQGQVRPFQPNPPCLMPERRFITETVTYPDGYKQEVTYPVGQRPDGLPPGVQWAEPDGIAQQLLHARPGQVSVGILGPTCGARGWSQGHGIVPCLATKGHNGEHQNSLSDPWVSFNG